jgi:hypothetical protein
VHVFDDEAEEEARIRLKNASNGNGAGKVQQTGDSGTGKKRLPWNQEQKRRAKEEALRLLTGRRELPVFGGTLLQFLY